MWRRKSEWNAITASMHGDTHPKEQAGKRLLKGCVSRERERFKMTILCMQSEYVKMCVSGRTDRERERKKSCHVPAWRRKRRKMKMAGGLDLCACVKTPQNQPAKKDERQHERAECTLYIASEVQKKVQKKERKKHDRGKRQSIRMLLLLFG